MNIQHLFYLLDSHPYQHIIFPSSLEQPYLVTHSTIFQSKTIYHLSRPSCCHSATVFEVILCRSFSLCHLHSATTWWANYYVVTFLVPNSIALLICQGECHIPIFGPACLHFTVVLSKDTMSQHFVLHLSLVDCHLEKDSVSTIFNPSSPVWLIDKRTAPVRPRVSNLDFSYYFLLYWIAIRGFPWFEEFIFIVKATILWKLLGHYQYLRIVFWVIPYWFI